MNLETSLAASAPIAGWRPRRWRAALLGVAVLAPMLSFAGAASAGTLNPDEVVSARAQFDGARRGGDGAAAERSVQAFGHLLAQDPGNPLLMAYHGSSVTLEAREAWAPWNKMRYVEDGLDEIDKALALLQPEQESQTLAGMPVALVTRFVSLSTFVAVPGFLHRLGDARDLLQRSLQSPSYKSAPDGLKASFAYQAALIEQRDGHRDAEIAQLRQVLALSPAGESAPAARARLKELGQ